MSLVLISGIAPSLISLFVPSLFALFIFPGIAYTSLPCSRANSDVINDPLLIDASTTITPFERPLIILLRPGKF